MSPAKPDKVQAFAVKRGEIKGRLDVVFHQPWIRAKLLKIEESRFETLNLGALLLDIRYGTSTPPPFIQQGPEAVPFVRATDIKEGEICTDTLLYISKEQPKLMEKCRLRGGELIIVRSGVNTGDCTVVPATLAGAFAAYDLILTFRDAVNARFIADFLDTDIGRLQLNIVRGRAAQPHVNAEEVSALRIPLPQRTLQDEFVSAMDAARAARREKLAQAEALLAGLDAYILDTLGLTLPKDAERKAFAIHLDSLRGHRLDPPAYQPLYAKGNPPKTPLRPLHELAEIDSHKYEKPEDEEELVPYVGLPECEQTEVREIAVRPYFEVKGRSIVRSGDILFARIEPSVFNQKYVLVEDLKGHTFAYTSTEFYVVTPRNDVALREYLYAMFFCSFVFAQTKGKTTGSSGRRRLDPYTFRMLQIPTPDMRTQQQIGAELTRCRNEARRLREQAEADWQAAKRHFEGELLKGR